MAIYKCFFCGKKVNHKILEKNFICPNCGQRVFYKPRFKVKRLKAI
ncbi:MAG: DNA-directed RNA polymerase subunit P [Candidatus Pacearchaeota archaeon]